jgi:hypothetical protein
LSVFGSDLELIPKSLVEIDVSDIYLKEIHVQNFPPSLLHLYLGKSSPKALRMLPKTLSSLCFLADPESHILNSEVCERMEDLKHLTCSWFTLASVSCLTAFKNLKNLTLAIGAYGDMYSDEEDEEGDENDESDEDNDGSPSTYRKTAPPQDLFKHLSFSSLQSLEEVCMDIGSKVGQFWPVWVAQFNECPQLRSITCTVDGLCKGCFARVPQMSSS